MSILNIIEEQEIIIETSHSYRDIQRLNPPISIFKDPLKPLKIIDENGILLGWWPSLKDFFHPVCRDTNFSFVIEKRLCAMAMPSFYVRSIKEEIRFLLDMDIHFIVNLTDLDYKSPDYRKNFKIIDVPVPDFDAPTFDQIEKIWDIFKTSNSKRRLCIHCVAGRGRTGTVLACILGRYHHLKPDIAIDRIRKMRPGSIETGLQEEFIWDYLYSLDS